MAPEYGTVKAYDTQSDMFSLDMLIYALYNSGRTLYECHDSYSSFMKMPDDLKSMNTTKLSSLPMEVREHVKMLLSTRPELRPDAGQFSKVNFKHVSMNVHIRVILLRFRFLKMSVRKH